MSFYIVTDYNTFLLKSQYLDCRYYNIDTALALSRQSDGAVIDKEPLEYSHL